MRIGMATTATTNIKSDASCAWRNPKMIAGSVRK